MRLVHAEAEPSEHGWHEHIQEGKAAHQLAQVRLDADAQQLGQDQILRYLHCSVLISSCTSEESVGSSCTSTLSSSKAPPNSSRAHSVPLLHYKHSGGSDEAGGGAQL